jgi:hypothetical protein
MDWSWLGDLFHGIVAILKGIVRLKWSDIWKVVQDVYDRIRAWLDWYQKNIQSQIQRAQQLFAQLYDQFVLPIVKMIDTIRRITGLVGLFNKRLAAKLNLLFLRIEGKLLLPLSTITARLNKIGGMFTGFLTALGYIDRATLVNSVWRDVALLKEIFRNPLGGVIAPQTIYPPPTPKAATTGIDGILSGQTSDLKTASDQAIAQIDANLSA